VRAVVASVVLVLSCGGSEPPAEPPPPLPDDLIAFSDALVDHAATFAETDGLEREDPAMLAVAERARAHNVEVVRRANGDRDWYLANMEEALMAALGLIEHVDATGDDRDLADIDAFVDATNGLVFLFGDYLPTGAEIGSFALETYGPTAITGAAALMNLQYAAYIEGPLAERRLMRARGRLGGILNNQHQFLRAGRRRAPFERRGDRILLLGGEARGVGHADHRGGLARRIGHGHDADASDRPERGPGFVLTV